MILIFNKKTILICQIASILSIFNCKVLIISPSKSYFLRQLEKLGLKIRCSSLLYMDMSSQNIKDLTLADGDRNKVSDKCVENLYQNIDNTKDLSLFFPNIKDLQKKLKLFVYHHFDELFFYHQTTIMWLQSSTYKNSIIINFLTLRPGLKRVWRNSDLKVIFIFNYLNFFIGLACKSSVFLIKYLIKKINSNPRTLKKKNNTDFYQNDVLFFPHCGVVTFTTPPKDHFYSDQIDSPFHPSKIIHLEYDNRPDIEVEKNRMKKYLHTNSIHYKKFYNSGIPWFGAIRFIIKIIPAIKLFQFKNIKNNILFYGIMFNAYVMFTRNLNMLGPYRAAKIALVGYEILFPKELALALESLNIKTVAVTDRFYIPYTNCQSFSFDTFLSSSKSSSEIIKNSDRFLTNDIFSVGQVRTDHFFDKDISRSKFKERVVVLDYHIDIDRDLEAQKFETIVNWKNDINFRKEILLLAEFYPDIEFVFRGKNCNWYKNEQHHQVISKANKLPNVRVDEDYSENCWQSYHLCASADLIIARPTSLAEECVSKGLDVIVLDYAINYSISVSKFLPKLLREYYCHNFEELKCMFEFWKKHKYVVPKNVKNQIQTDIFSNLTDGKVKERIQKYLNEIYEPLK